MVSIPRKPSFAQAGKRGQKALHTRSQNWLVQFGRLKKSERRIYLRRRRSHSLILWSVQCSLLGDSLETAAGDYPAIYESLAEAIRKGDQSVYAVSPEQAILNIRIIEAGFQSSKEGRYVEL